MDYGQHEQDMELRNIPLLTKATTNIVCLFAMQTRFQVIQKKNCTVWKTIEEMAFRICKPFFSSAGYKMLSLVYTRLD